MSAQVNHQLHHLQQASGAQPQEELAARVGRQPQAAEPGQDHEGFLLGSNQRVLVLQNEIEGLPAGPGSGVSRRQLPGGQHQQT